jgi:small subunit ribosomal protein S3
VGQKVNPVGFRRGVYTSWESRWFARGKKYAQSFFEDLAVRDLIKKSLSSAEVSYVEIEKTEDSVRIIIHSARPGQVIGKKGQDIESLRNALASLLNKKVEVSVQEIRQPELDARLIAQDIAEQMQRRSSYKRAMKKAATEAMRAGARGIAIRVAGRLGGADIARDEKVSIGSLPRHTLRANIEYGTAVAYTTYGTTGVKVWVCRGEFSVGQ